MNKIKETTGRKTISLYGPFGYISCLLKQGNEAGCTKAKMSRLFVTACLCFLACKEPAPKEPELKTMNEGKLLSRGFFFSLPYEETSDGAAVVRVVLKGKPCRFMLDTGAPLSISRSLQKALGFPVLQDTQLRDANGDSTGVKIVRVKGLSVGPVQIDDVPALVLDLESPLFACDKLDGLIGSNLLRLLVIQFNKPEKRISFGDNLDSFRLDKSATSLHMQLSDGQSDPMLAVRLNDAVNDTVFYDTGDAQLYSLSKIKFDRFNATGRFAHAIVRRGNGIGSQGVVAANTDGLPSLLVNVDSFGVGAATIRNVAAPQQNDNRSRMGRGLWEYGVVTMDYLHQNFYFTPRQPVAAFQAKPHFGFQFGERNGKLVATVVWEGTKAFWCGLRPGAEIVQLGNFVPKTVALCEWQNFTGRETEADTLLIKYVGEKGEAGECRLQKLYR